MVNTRMKENEDNTVKLFMHVTYMYLYVTVESSHFGGYIYNYWMSTVLGYIKLLYIPKACLVNSISWQTFFAGANELWPSGIVPYIMNKYLPGTVGMYLISVHVFFVY